MAGKIEHFQDEELQAHDIIYLAWVKTSIDERLKPLYERISSLENELESQKIEFRNQISELEAKLYLRT